MNTHSNAQLGLRMFKFLGLAIIYALISELGMMINAVQGNVATVWPAAGFGFASLFLGGIALWPSIWLGELLDVFFFGSLPIGEIMWRRELASATQNTLALVAGVGLIRSWVQDNELFNSSQRLILFLVGGTVSTLIGSTLGVGLLYLYQELESANFFQVWWTWSFADFVGILGVAPSLIVWQSQKQIAWSTGKWVEAILLLICLGIANWTIFGQWLLLEQQVYPLTYLLMLFPIWGAFRFSQRESMLVIVLISIVAIVATLYNMGPFVRLRLYESLFLLQSFLAVLSITTLFLIALLNERWDLEHSLRHSQQALQLANAELERRVIERTEKLRLLNEELRKSSEQYQSIFENAIEGIYRVNPSGQLLNANPALARMYGYENPQHMLAEVKNIRDLFVDPTARSTLEEQLNRQNTVHEFEAVVLRKEGDTMSIAENSRAVRDDRGLLLYYEGTMVDITGRKEAEQQWVKLAHYDPLTGLANRRLFLLKLKQAMAHAREQGSWGILAYFDLDGFKQVNDQLGHEFGDELLKVMAQRLKQCTRSSDTLCRLGGDEFTLIAENVSRQQDASSIAKKILTTLKAPVIYRGQSATVGISMGIVFFDGHNYDTNTLITQADQAMYQAKREGKGTYRFSTGSQPI